MNGRKKRCGSFFACHIREKMAWSAFFFSKRPQSAASPHACAAGFTLRRACRRRAGTQKGLPLRGGLRIPSGSLFLARFVRPPELRCRGFCIRCIVATGAICSFGICKQRKGSLSAPFPGSMSLLRRAKTSRTSGPPRTLALLDGLEPRRRRERSSYSMTSNSSVASSGDTTPSAVFARTDRL